VKCEIAKERPPKKTTRCQYAIIKKEREKAETVPSLYKDMFCTIGSACSSCSSDIRGELFERLVRVDCHALKTWIRI